MVTHRVDGRAAAGWRRLLGPLRCLSCERVLATARELLLCDGCVGALASPAVGRCRGCGRTCSARGRCAPCLLRPPPWDRLLVAWDYAAPLDAVIRALKYERLFFLGEQLGRRLALGLAGLIGPVDAVVAVPMPLGRRLVRGFDQADLLAAPLGAALDRPRLHPIRRRHGPRFATLAALARRRAARSFVLRRGRRLPPHVLLVDDVITTGATLRTCTNLLLRAGAARVTAVVAARTPTPAELAVSGMHVAAR